MDVQFKRNIAILGHAHCGKTTLTESMLYFSGTSSRKGDVMQGSSLSDFQDDEKERQISINNAFLNINYNKYTIQTIDTPGYMDFIGETLCAIKVADAAIVVVDCLGGVEVGTETAWQALEQLKTPRLIFINKTDKEGANLEETIQLIKDELSTRAILIDKNSSDFIESVAETDDDLLEKYLDEGTLSEEEINSALKKGILESKIYPIISGCALNDENIDTLLDYIVTYLPSPIERLPIKTKKLSSDETFLLKPSTEGEICGFVFKTISDAHLGQLSLMKIFSGTLASNTDLFNVTQDAKEHIGTINILNGKDSSQANSATCGDIIALPKLKNTHVSDTLCSNGDKLIISPIEFPESSISSSIKPKSRADEDKIFSSLHKLCEEDHTFKITRNEETKELIISGIGDLHLKVMVERLKKRYHVEVELGTPKVTYRETILRKGSARYKHKKQSGGHGQYGDVALEIEPLPLNGEHYEFVNKIFGGAIPRNFIPSVEKGVQTSIKNGVLTGYPLDHIKVTVVDGSYHDVDSSDMAFQIAAAHAMKEAVLAAGPVLLEPIMSVSITVPDEFIGQISGDISSRRGRIMATEVKGKKEIIKANIPLSEMFSYATDLRSMTGGRGSYSMIFSHYEHAPSKIKEQILASVEAGV